MTAVIFDVGKVLIDWDARRIYRDDFASDAEIEAFFEEIGFHAWNLAQDAGRSWADGVAHLSERHPHRAQLIAKYASHWHLSVPGLIDGSIEILGNLRAAGVPLYAITNFAADKWAETVGRFPVLGTSFLGTVVSAHEGVAKPDPAIFELFLGRYGLTAGQCVFIDDSPVNVASAARLGIDAIRFRSPETLLPMLRERGLPA